MATGFTQDVEDLNAKLPELNEFAWRCARAFDIWCKDNEGDPPLSIPRPASRRKESLRRLKKAEAKVKAIKAKPAKKLEAERDKEYRERLKEAEESLQKAQEVDRRCAEMKRRVNAWRPSRKLSGLKRFMLDQLGMSRSMVQYYQREVNFYSTRSPISFYRAALLKAARIEIRFAKKDLQREKENCGEVRNAYFAALNASLPRPA